RTGALTDCSRTPAAPAQRKPPWPLCPAFPNPPARQASFARRPDATKANCPRAPAQSQAVDYGDCGDKVEQAVDCIGTIKRGFLVTLTRIRSRPSAKAGTVDGWFARPVARR